jgi:gliding motility-associated lipoprotein GldH
MKVHNGILFCLFVGLLFGCQEAPLYEKVYGFENNEWTQRVKPEFKVEIADTTSEYDFVLTLRTTTDYKFNNLWVFLNTKTPSGTKAREPFEIRITNPDGTWAGKKTGTVVEFPLTFRRRKLPEKGTYWFTLEQGITASTIDEVLDLGFRVDQVK